MHPSWHHPCGLTRRTIDAPLTMGTVQTEHEVFLLAVNGLVASASRSAIRINQPGISQDTHSQCSPTRDVP
jgi:hypothetical protein